MHGAGAFFSSRPAPYFYYKHRIIRNLHFCRGAGPEHFFAPAPFRPWKWLVFMDEIGILPFRPQKRRVFMDEIGMPGISQYWFFLFFYFVKKTICVFCLREG